MFTFNVSQQSTLYVYLHVRLHASVRNTTKTGTCLNTQQNNAGIIQPGQNVSVCHGSLNTKLFRNMDHVSTMQVKKEELNAPCLLHMAPYTS